MAGEKEESQSIRLALLEQNYTTLKEKVEKNASDNVALESEIQDVRRRVNVFEGGVSWVYKGIFAMTAMIGAFLAFFEKNNGG